VWNGVRGVEGMGRTKYSEVELKMLDDRHGDKLLDTSHH